MIFMISKKTEVERHLSSTFNFQHQCVKFNFVAKLNNANLINDTFNFRLDIRKEDSDKMSEFDYFKHIVMFICILINL